MDLRALLSRPVCDINCSNITTTGDQECTKKITRNKFTSDEDRILAELVAANGLAKGLVLASERLQRTMRQCKERWNFYLSPDIQTDKWSKQEDDMLVTLVTYYGKRWSLICQQFPKRTVISVRNRYRQLFRHLTCVFGNENIAQLPAPDEKTMQAIRP